MQVYYLNDLARRVYKRGELDYYRYYDVRAGINGFKTDIDKVLYEGCVRNECKKKVWPTPYGSFHCEKCNCDYFHFQWRYKLKVFLEDESGMIMVTMFDEMAETLLGISAPELSDVHDYDIDHYYSIFDQVLDDYRMYYFTLKVALVIFNERKRLSGIVQELEY